MEAEVDTPVGSFIIDAPRETGEDIQVTINLARRLNLDISQINIPGTFQRNLIWE
jgi:hypothetical protein